MSTIEKIVIPESIIVEFEAIVPREGTVPVDNKSVTITENGSHEVTANPNTVMSKVDITVDVPSSPSIEMQDKSITITENGSYTVSADEGKAMDNVSIEVIVPVTALSELSKEITENGEFEYIPDENGAFSRVKIKVNVSMDIIDNLLSDRADAALSAKQGKVLNENKAEKIAVVEQTSTYAKIAPNVLNKWGEVTTLVIELDEPIEGVLNEYMIQFTSSASGTSLVLPSDIKWLSAPTITENKVYQISIINKLAVIAEFPNE